MNTKRRTVLGIILFAMFLTISYVAYGILSNRYKVNQEIQLIESNASQNNVKIPAPDFTVFDAKGNEVKLSDFKGKTVVLNFWASWCPPCKREMPDFNEVYADVKDDVVFMMIDLVDGQQETQEKGAKYIESMGYNFPIYFDNKQSAAQTYGISSIPTTLFIDADGNIMPLLDAHGNTITAYQGAMDKKTLHAVISSIHK